MDKYTFRYMIHNSFIFFDYFITIKKFNKRRERDESEDDIGAKYDTDCTFNLNIMGQSLICGCKEVQDVPHEAV